jgi:hypothetical protein
MVDRKIWKQSFYKDELGWPELAASVVAVWDGLPASEQARAAVIAGNYGEASALEHFGPGKLPLVVSGHLSWQYWRPRTLPQRYAITVGMGDHPDICRASRVVARIDNKWHIANEEQGRPIVACTLRQPLGRLWESSIPRNSL